MRMSNVSGSRRFEITTPDLAMRDTVILGQFNNVQCHSGLSVHATDTREVHDMTMQWRMQASLTIAVILEGMLDIHLDDQPMPLGRNGTPAGHVWSLSRTTLMRRESRKGMRIRKVIISLPPDWIAPLLSQHGLPNRNLQRLVNTHRSTANWTPSRNALSLAEQIIAPSDALPPMRKLGMESKAIEIVREALSQIIAPDAATPAPRTRGRMRAQRIRRHLEVHLDRNLPLNAMAQELGLSVGSMQSAFKQAYRTTIAEFCRELRLQRARTAIEQDGISISEAAYRAGYTSPASFSTAFKRLYGFSPSAAKA